MIPIQLEGATQFGKPHGWDESKQGRCFTLPAVRNGLAITSVWSFSDSERARVARGENLSVTVYGSAPQPILLKIADIQGDLIPGFAHPVAVEPARSTADRYVYSAPDAA
jgi:hypothetical protein